jgi:hypothetical protein
MGRGDMRPPAWFVRELKLIDPKFYVVWEPRGQRFVIVSPAPVSVFRKGYVSEYLVELNGQFSPLDRRVIQALQFLMWEKNQMVSLDHYLQDRKGERRESRSTDTREDGRFHEES